MLIFNYKSKKQLRENIGNKLNYTETSMFGLEYKKMEFWWVATDHLILVIRVRNFLQK